MARASNNKIPIISWVIFFTTVFIAIINFSKENLNPDNSHISIFFLGFVGIALDVCDLLTENFEGKLQQIRNYRIAGWILFAVSFAFCLFFFLCMIDFFTIGKTNESANYFMFNPNHNFNYFNQFLGDRVRTSTVVWAYYSVFIGYAIFRLVKSSFVKRK